LCGLGRSGALLEFVEEEVINAGMERYLSVVFSNFELWVLGGMVELVWARSVGIVYGWWMGWDGFGVSLKVCIMIPLAHMYTISPPHIAFSIRSQKLTTV